MASEADKPKSAPASTRVSIPDDPSVRIRIGRYELFERIASGGMATVYFGRLMGGAGFKRAVALKRLHPHLAGEQRFVSMLRDEARLASRIKHRSVVPVLDVVEVAGELLLVMELVEGPSLGDLLQALRDKGEPMPLPICGGILRGVLAGVRAAHEAKDESGVLLELVHRDISPANVILGVDGIARVADFGIAKARGRVNTTHDGSLKGNFGYMAPEQAKRKPVTPRTDLYAVGVLLWECVTGKRMHGDDEPAAILTRMLYEEPMAPSELRDVSPDVDALVKKALAKEPNDRFQNAAEMSDAIGAALGTAGPEEVARFLKQHLPEHLASLRARIERVENAPMADDITGPLQPVSIPAASEVAPENGGRVTAVVHDISIAPPPRGKPRWIAPAALIAVAIGGGALLASRRAPAPIAPATASPAEPPAAPAKTIETIKTAAAPLQNAPPATASASPEPSAAPADVAALAKAPESKGTRRKPPRTNDKTKSPPAATSTTAPAAQNPPTKSPTGLEGIPGERE